MQQRSFLLPLVRQLSFLLVIWMAACTPLGSVPPPSSPVPAMPVSAAQLTAVQPAERTPLVVFAAGSLIIPFASLEKAFEARYPQIDVQAEYHGSIQVIRHATELHESIDIVATADAALIPLLMYAGTDPQTGRPYANWYIRFASNRLALAYQPQSLYALEINAQNWAELLARSDVKVGLADPRFDAVGYRALMAYALAERAREQYTLFGSMFNDQFRLPVTIFRDDHLTTITVPEVLETRSGAHLLLRGASVQLIALLEAGELDYAFEYESVIQQHGLNMLALPGMINLGASEYDDFYRQAQVKLDFQRFASVKPVFAGETIAYGITIPSSAPQPAAAAQFIAFLLSPEGKAVMEQNYHPVLAQSTADGFENLPAGLQPLCQLEKIP